MPLKQVCEIWGGREHPLGSLQDGLTSKWTPPTHTHTPRQTARQPCVAPAAQLWSADFVLSLAACCRRSPVDRLVFLLRLRRGLTSAPLCGFPRTRRRPRPLPRCVSAPAPHSPVRPPALRPAVALTGCARWRSPDRSLASGRQPAATRSLHEGQSNAGERSCVCLSLPTGLNFLKKHCK